MTERTVWRKPRPANETRRSNDLTPDEQRNVKAALRVLARRYGNRSKLAQALKANVHTVNEATTKRGAPSPALALRAARLAGRRGLARRGMAGARRVPALRA